MKYEPRQKKTCLRVYADSKIPDQPAQKRSVIWSFTDRLLTESFGTLEWIDGELISERDFAGCSGWIIYCISSLFVGSRSSTVVLLILDIDYSSSLLFSVLQKGCA